MEKLTTNYLGLTLKSPVIISSSRLTSTIENLREAEECGVGAVVLKSLFEEQIMHHIGSLSSSPAYPEADDYIAYYTKSHSVDEYLSLIRNGKKYLSIPVIPSINCFSSEGWIDFAVNIAEAGADALEVNVYFMPLDRKRSAADAEKIYFELIEKLRAKVKIPISIKIGSRFVMFNRFYEPDIDVNTMQIVPASIFSSSDERRNVLRSVAMASAQDIKIDISASTGAHSSDDIIRYLLAGADTVQVCSVLYQKGIKYLKTMNEELSEWMGKNSFRDIDGFRGKLNWKNYDKPAVFERMQFMKYFSSQD